MGSGRVDTAALAEDLGVVLARLYGFLRRSILPRGMSLTQALALATLRDSGPQRVTDLAELEGVRQPTCTALVNAMELEGWVSRSVDEYDRRAVVVDLTPKGREVLRSITRARSRLLAGYLTDLSASEQRALAAALPALKRLIEGGADGDTELLRQSETISPEGVSTR
jgi:DNA-binding MarR family transcriptional regulator